MPRKDYEDRNNLTFSIKDTKFIINFVSNYVIKKWNDLQKGITIIQKISADIQKRIKTLSDKNIDDAQIMSDDKIKEYTAQLSKYDKDYIFNSKDAILKELLESNGYEYDQDFIDKNTSPTITTGIIMDCINKDLKKK